MEKALERTLPAEQVRYLKQPFNITMLHGLMSKAQQKQLVLIMDELQPKIEAWLALGLEQQRKNPSFAYNDTDLTVSIKLSDLGISSRYYEPMREAARLFSNQIYEFCFKNDAGENRVGYAPLFSLVDVPEKGTRTTKPVTINFTFNSVILKSNLMEMTRYSKYSRTVALHSGLYTSRIYIILNSYIFSPSKTWTVGYNELRKILGVDKISQSEKKKEYKWSKEKYVCYVDFRKRVLDDSKKELDALAEQGLAECSFTYEPIWERRIRTGDPDKIAFKVILSSCGEKQFETKQKTEQMKKELTERYGFNSKHISMLRSSIFEIDYDYFLKILKTVDNATRNRTDIGKRTNYIVRCINNEVINWEERQQTIEFVDADYEEIKPSSQVGEKISPTTPEPSSVQQREESHLIPGEGAEKWAALLSEYDGPDVDFWSRGEYLGLDNGLFCIGYKYMDVEKAVKLAMDDRFAALLRKYSAALSYGRKINIVTL